MSQGSPAVDEASEVFTPLYPVRSKFVIFSSFSTWCGGRGGLLIHICDCETHNLTYLHMFLNPFPQGVLYFSYRDLLSIIAFSVAFCCLGLLGSGLNTCDVLCIRCPVRAQY